MKILSPFFDWFDRNQFSVLRWSLGVVYVWFGMLKFFPGVSPAETLAKDTIHTLFFGIIPDTASLALLASWEVGIGILFFTGMFTRFAVKAAIVHMICTFLPLFFFVDLSFTGPFAFTIIGQYIMKNLVFLVAMGILLKQENRVSVPATA